jgi:hypothetical protein
MRFWVRSVDKQSLGPFTPEQIRKIPGVNEDTFIYPESGQGSSAWKRLRDVPELIQARRIPPPPPRAEPVPLTALQPTAVAAPRAAPFMSKLALLAVAAVAAATIVGVRRWRADRAQEEAVRTELKRRTETLQQEQAKRHQVEARAEQAIEQQRQGALRDGERVIQEDGRAIPEVEHAVRRRVALFQAGNFEAAWNMMGRRKQQEFNLQPKIIHLDTPPGGGMENFVVAEQRARNRGLRSARIDILDIKVHGDRASVKIRDRDPKYGDEAALECARLELQDSEWKTESEDQIYSEAAPCD